ncbi:MAG: hypothetical protein AB7O38_09080 [Pirellulaceae bacterium]
MSRNWIQTLVLSVVAVAITPWAAGEDAVSLQHKFPDGRRSTFHISNRVHQVLTLHRQSHEVSSEQQLVVVAVCGNRDKDGELRERVSIESLTAKMTMPGGIVLEFDSRRPEDATSGTRYDTFLDTIRIQAGSSWSVLRGKDHRVKSVDNRDKVLENLDQASRDRLKRALDPGYLRDRANRELDQIPDRPLSPGDSWELADTMRLEAGQRLEFKATYVYRGTVTRDDRLVHQIDKKTTEVQYRVDTDIPGSLALAASRLQPTTVEGVLYFDAERGQIVESRDTVQIAGDLTFRLQDAPLEGRLDLTLTNTLRVVD